MHRILQSETFKASAAELYALLTDADRFAKMTGGASAAIDINPGGEISLFGGMITGRTIEVVQNELVVQAWRPKPWGRGVYSIVKFEIESDRDTATISLDQAGFPEDQGEHLSKGWQDNYWNNIRAAIGE